MIALPLRYAESCRTWEGVMDLQSTTDRNGRTMTVPGSAHDCADPWESSMSTMGLSDGPHHHHALLHVPPALLVVLRGHVLQTLQQA